MEDIEAKLGRHAAKDSPLGQSLTALMRADPGFDPSQFLDGAKRRRIEKDGVSDSQATEDANIFRELITFLPPRRIEFLRQRGHGRQIERLAAGFDRQ